MGGQSDSSALGPDDLFVVPESSYVWFECSQFTAGYSRAPEEAGSGPEEDCNGSPEDCYTPEQDSYAPEEECYALEEEFYALE